MYRQLLVLIVLISTQLYSSDRYLGFDDAVPAAWHPGLGLTMKKSKLLERMRLEGPYGPKEMALQKEWRQSTFESFRTGDHARNTANSINYPLNAIAAFIQWCFPSPGEIMLEPNVNCHDPLGTLAKLWSDNRKQASTCFSVLMKTMNTLYNCDAADIEDMAPAVRAEITKTLPKETPRLDVFLDIFMSAVYLERFERPEYYPKETVRQTFISYLTDIVHDKGQLVEIYRNAGLLIQEPVDMPMTKEVYDTLTVSMKTGSSCTFDEFVQFLTLDDKFGSGLPPFLRMDRSTVQIADGYSVSFADCGEMAFLNFCLTFLWGQQKVNPERWSTLKDEYPKFRPFVEFFETNTTLTDIEANRSYWSTLMAFQKPMIETSFNKVDYNRRGKAELVGGNQSFLNLISILFSEDSVLNTSFITEQLTSSNDIDLAQKKWERFVQILNCGKEDGPCLDSEKSKFKSDAELHFSLGKAGQEKQFRFYLGRNHFVMSAIEQDASLSVQVLNKEADAAITTLLGATHSLISSYTPFFFMGEYEWSTIPKPIEKNEKMTMIVRYLMRLSQNRMDDEYVIKRVIDKLKFWFPDEPLKDIMSNLVRHSLGKIFLYQYIAPNAFLEIEHQEIKDALQSVLTDIYFKEMMESAHPNRYQLVCFYGKQLPALKKIKRSPDHKDYNTIFNGSLHEKHPLVMAARNGQMNVVNLITDNGNAVFWKMGAKSCLDDSYLLKEGIENPEIIRFLIQHNPAIFETQKRSGLYIMLSGCSVASYDALFQFLCDSHQFSKKELLEMDYKEAYDELDDLDRANFLEFQLCSRCYMSDYEWGLSRSLVQKILPDYKVTQSVFIFLLNMVLRCNHLDRVPDVLRYAEPDVIRESLEIIPFGAAQMQFRMKDLEMLYPYFSIKTWDKVLSGFFSIDDDTLTWLALNALFTHMDVSHEFLQTVKKILVEKRGEDKLFLLALFVPNVLPDNHGDSWKEVCQKLSVSDVLDKQAYQPKIKEQMENLSKLCADIA